MNHYNMKKKAARMRMKLLLEINASTVKEVTASMTAHNQKTIRLLLRIVPSLTRISQS